MSDKNEALHYSRGYSVGARKTINVVRDFLNEGRIVDLVRWLDGEQVKHETMYQESLEKLQA